MRPLQSLVRYFADRTFRPAAVAGADMVELALSTMYAAARAYFTCLSLDQLDLVVID
ncbi:hypothetical protein F5Y19DRAFT_415020 [Xylariaceae sp. FL1651]|nr:hypothetical protein F5Y19DRAFT_415020 [Xylariaceae sp. FL1651]